LYSLGESVGHGGLEHGHIEDWMNRAHGLWKMERNNRVLSYASPLVRKLHPHSEVTSKTYKPAFHGGHLSHNMSYSGAATSGYSVFQGGDTPIQLGLP